MYSGTTLTVMSGRVLGAHQKIDRLARASLRSFLKDNTAFPAIKHILHFEGVNGPDAIKRKSPAKDEPWHFIAPFDDEDTQLAGLITDHYNNLVGALRGKDDVRAAFEAAWLAHAVVDGLTPAHHYPYEEKLEELRGGEGNETRTTLKGKLLMPGHNRRDAMRNNWKMWGPGGLMTTHGFFEWGVAALLAPVSPNQIRLSARDFAEIQEKGAVALFKQKAREVAGLNMYERYYQVGWTPALAKQAKQVLIPVIVQTVILIWYAAAEEAGLIDIARAAQTAPTPPATRVKAPLA